MRAEISESKVATVTSSVHENDPAPRTDTFADHVNRVLWSVGVLGLPCMWMPEEYGGSAFVHEVGVVEDRSRHIQIDARQIAGLAQCLSV